MSNVIAPELLNILACPADKAVMKYNKTKTALVCTKCSAEYAIRDGIPVLLPK